jgi:hypothetical protein
MPTDQIDRAALGRARLAERARRVARIRRTVVAATLSAFVMAWGVIVFDGSMGATTLASAQTATPGAAAAATPAATSSDTTSSVTTSSTTTPPAVTTSQS